mmetsp:Transcript_12108/g.15849  ORF Transcript_12108/g.15849 Transcript_12108/m.15849 type:complete len:131 (-) Transcript_12108:219-611(-)|eukprot:CAMPEP_0198136448 /NCGR_PEP_ID=MMETSP1443-20131203/94_1 /TAXON_ID=186043 /ORGANISM="Entomoneis sp., Strain CCMP2396" /LENGTH=130 /DNA_ID=CAMNT_0043797673 /DNA_START=112 /DNA_END=504 /DNA_ORIENTATION=-
MNIFRNIFALLCLLASSNAFSLNGAASGGSSFVVSQRASAAAATVALPRVNNARPGMFMGPKSKFGVFSPAVYAARVVLGSKKLNMIRGKGISLHSAKISEFCTFFGAYHLRTRLVKKAKNNGDILGFLV